MYDLLKPFETYRELPVPGLSKLVTDDLGNMHSLMLQYDLRNPNIDIAQYFSCVIGLSIYNLTSGNQLSLDPIFSLKQLVEQSNDRSLHSRYFLAALEMSGNEHRNKQNSVKIHMLAQEALTYFEEKNDVAGQGM